MLVNHLDLLSAWTGRIIRARYQQSILGGLWAVLQPVATVIIFSVIFTRLVPIDTGSPYLLFSYAAMAPWTFLSASIQDMTNSLVENMNLVTKIYFPREILPIAALAARFLDFLIAESLLVILILVYRQPFYLAGWLFLPVIVLIQTTLSLGIGLIAAALNVFYRDVKHIVALVLQLWFYASPIIYPYERVPADLRTLYSLNPMVGVINAYRDLVLNEKFPDVTLLYSAGFALALLVAGYFLFKRVEYQFADIV